MNFELPIYRWKYFREIELSYLVIPQKNSKPTLIKLNYKPCVSFFIFLPSPLSPTNRAFICRSSGIWPKPFFYMKSHPAQHKRKLYIKQKRYSISLHCFTHTRIPMSQPKATNSNFGQTKNICCMEYSLMPKKKEGIIDDNIPKKTKKKSGKMSVNFHWHNDIYSTTLLEHFSFGDIWDMAMSTTFCKK